MSYNIGRLLHTTISSYISDFTIYWLCFSLVLSIFLAWKTSIFDKLCWLVKVRRLKHARKEARCFIVNVSESSQVNYGKFIYWREQTYEYSRWNLFNRPVTQKCIIFRHITTLKLLWKKFQLMLFYFARTTISLNNSSTNAWNLGVQKWTLIVQLCIIVV